MKIKDRIRQNFKPGVDYDALMARVFPPEDFPNAWRYSTRGGPPGCSMAFSRALREMKASVSYEDSEPGPRDSTRNPPRRRVWGVK